MTKPHKNAEFIKAYANGENVQWKLANGTWHDIQSGGESLLFENLTFRIKPEQLWYRVALFKDRIGHFEVVVDSEIDEQVWQQDAYFVRWLTERVPYDI